LIVICVGHGVTEHVSVDHVVMELADGTCLSRGKGTCLCWPQGQRTCLCFSWGQVASPPVPSTSHSKYHSNILKHNSYLDNMLIFPTLDSTDVKIASRSTS